MLEKRQQRVHHMYSGRLQFFNSIPAEIQFLLLFIQNEYVPMESGTFWWEWLQIWYDCLSFWNVTAWYISAKNLNKIVHLSLRIYICEWNRQAMRTYTNQCTYSLSFSVKWPSGLVRINVHSVSPSGWFERKQKRGEHRIKSKNLLGCLNKVHMFSFILDSGRVFYSHQM